MATYKDVLMLVDKVTQPLQKIEKQTAKVTSKMDNMKKQLKDLGGKFGAFAKKAALGLAVVAGAFTYAMKKTVDYGDRIDKMSQKIGMSRKAFQEWDYIMSQNGGSVESLQMGFKTLTTQIEGVQKGSKDSVNAFKALGVSVKDSNGQFRSQDEIFNDTIRKLQQIKNPTQKAMLANRLFGRSAAELRPLLTQEASAVDELRDKANKLGLIVSEEDIKNAVILKDTFDTFSRAFQARFATVMMKVMPYFTKALETVTPLIKTISDYIVQLGANMKSSPAFAMMSEQFRALGDDLTKFYIENKDFFDALQVAFEWLMSTGLPNLTTSIVAIARGITFVVDIVFKTFKTIGGIIGTLIGMIISIPTNIQTAFIQVQTTILRIFNAIKGHIGNAIQFIISKLSVLLKVFGAIFSKIPALKGLGGILTDLAGSVNNNSVKQTQNNNTTNNTTTNNNYYGSPQRNAIGGMLQPAYTIPL